jgi:hypothetical protein
MTVASEAQAERNKSVASVVTGGDAAPVLQAGEHVLDTMTLAVENGVMGDGEGATEDRFSTSI